MLDLLYFDTDLAVCIKPAGVLSEGDSEGCMPYLLSCALKEKGIDEDLADKLLNEQEYNPFESALKLAKKKRIGPYCADENLRKERRNKDMGVLIRAGFDYDVVLKVLEYEEEE